MIGTKLKTHTDTRLFVIALRGVNEMTLNDPKLDEVIDYAVPEQILTTIFVRGVRGREIHAELRVDIDYSGTEPEFQVTDFAPPEGMPELDSQEEDLQEKARCRSWDEAARWFMEAIESAGLSPRWFVHFSEREDEMCERFGLVRQSFVDKCDGGPSRLFPHSSTSNLKMNVRGSSEIFGPESE